MQNGSWNVDSLGRVCCTDQSGLFRNPIYASLLVAKDEQSDKAKVKMLVPKPNEHAAKCVTKTTSVDQMKNIFELWTSNLTTALRIHTERRQQIFLTNTIIMNTMDSVHKWRSPIRKRVLPISRTWPTIIDLPKMIDLLLWNMMELWQRWYLQQNRIDVQWLKLMLQQASACW